MLLLLLPACDGTCNNGKCDDTTCEVVEAWPLTEVPEAEWPEGMAEIVDAWLARECTWNLTADGDGDAPGTGPALAEFRPCTIDERTLQTWNNSSACQALGVVVCGNAGFSIVGDGWTETSSTAHASLFGEKWEYLTETVHLWGNAS